MRQPNTRGVLYPSRLPTFTRLEPEPQLAELVVHYWIPEWDIAAGRTSRQQVLPYPASNLVVEAGRLTLHGPGTERSHRDLTGRGWAVGAMLRPAAVAAFTDDASGLRDTERLIDDPIVVAAVTAQMEGAHSDRLVAAARSLGAAILGRAGRPDPDALLANRLADVVGSDGDVLRLADVADRLAVSERTATRLAHRYIGITPAAMIRRRRLQEAAERLRLDPDIPLADLAAELGYADQAHLSREFRSVLDFTPSVYRRRVADADAAIVQPEAEAGL